MSPTAAELSFEDYARSRTSALLGFAHAVSGRPEDAADLVQEALLRTGTSWHKIRGDPEPYSRKIIVRLYLRQARRSRREASLAQFLHHGRQREATRDDPETYLDLVTALKGLSAGERAVVVLRHYADYTEAQAADVLGCSIGTVKSQTHRALGHLRVAMNASTGAEEQQ